MEPKPFKMHGTESGMMTTREELFAAARTIKSYCQSRDQCQVPPEDRCPFFTQFGSTWCELNNNPPGSWADPED